MAWTNAVITKGVEGHLRYHVISCTADSAETTVITGLQKINHHVYGPIDVTAGTNQVMLKNVGSTSTVLAGSVGCSGFTNGDAFYLKVYGN
jgi:hypothetical protein